MAIWVALLRGINVGGRNKLPMKGLSAAMEGAGFRDVATYIQSGNVVFRGPAGKPDRHAGMISKAIEAEFGFCPQVVVIAMAQFMRVIPGNPFPGAEREADGKLLHAFFLGADPGEIDVATVDAVKSPRSKWQLDGRVFYLYEPDGFHKSKLAARVERLLGVPATARNWRTVCKIGEMLADLK